MLIIKDIVNLQAYLKTYKLNNEKIGFVPTMGGLHEGHGNLIKSSQENNDKTIVSIFLNPKQFNNIEDLKRYPVNKGDDYDYCLKNKIDIIFEPNEYEIYPLNYKLIKNNFFQNILCDKFRPGHFDGVVSVVSELFKIIEPSNAYFGYKDYQQFKIIDQLAKKKFSKIIIKGVETVRDAMGLAFSTRNNLLNSNSKEIYSKFIFNMKNFINSLDSGLENSTANNLVRDFIKDTNTGIGKFDYHEFRSDPDLSLKGTINDSRFFLAFYLNSTRLIDNFKID